MTRTTAVSPPATLGVLGGGQLGRYFVMAARSMGYRTLVWEPDPSAPAGVVADEHVTAPYDDAAAADHVATRCAAVTTEFENPPATTLARLAAKTRVAPSPGAVAIAQDRIAEKAFLTSLGAEVAPYRAITTRDQLSGLELAYPALLKTARLGYDGKGQVTCTDAGELVAAWESLGEVPCVAEQRLALEGELSVVLARNAADEVAAFAPTANAHRHGVLDLSVAPVRGPVASAATELAVYIARSLDYVGVLGVEMFVVEGRLLVNELAPRPHNSGHWTLDAARTSQFEQQVRAICGVGLGDPTMTTPAVAMVNLLGDVWKRGEPHWAAPLSTPQAHVHLYGKATPRPGRKMGHLTVTGDDPTTVGDIAVHLRQRLTSPT